ncbi:MAG: hypothetical protein M3Z13_03580, partial [Candidatus Dormibacteraeota bacterium]|nr:hypothetical protein [Candidatus Dormibacteraeota bacterium]
MNATTTLSALSLLALAAALAGLAGSIRLVSRSDGRQRPLALGAGAGIGTMGCALVAMPQLLGHHALTGDISNLTVVVSAGLVAAIDGLETAFGVGLLIRAWPATAALREAETALSHGDAVNAAQLFRSALRPLVLGRQCERELQTRLNLAAALLGNGEVENAERALEEAVARAHSVADPSVSWNALIGAAEFEVDLGNWQQARILISDAANLAREHLSPEQVGLTFARLGWVAYLAGDHDLAAACLSWSARASGSVQSEGQLAGTTAALAGFLRIAAGDLVHAKTAITDARAIAESTHDRELEAQAKVAAACLAYFQGWHDSGLDSLRQALPVLRRVRFQSAILLPLLSLSLAARSINRPADA